MVPDVTGAIAELQARGRTRRTPGDGVPAQLQRDARIHWGPRGTGSSTRAAGSAARARDAERTPSTRSGARRRGTAPAGSRVGARVRRARHTAPPGGGRSTSPTGGERSMRSQKGSDLDGVELRGRRHDAAPDREALPGNPGDVHVRALRPRLRAAAHVKVAMGTGLPSARLRSRGLPELGEVSVSRGARLVGRSATALPLLEELEREVAGARTRSRQALAHVGDVAAREPLPARAEQLDGVMQARRAQENSGRTREKRSGSREAAPSGSVRAALHPPGGPGSSLAGGPRPPRRARGAGARRRGPPPSPPPGRTEGRDRRGSRRRPASPSSPSGQEATSPGPGRVDALLGEALDRDEVAFRADVVKACQSPPSRGWTARRSERRALGRGGVGARHEDDVLGGQAVHSGGSDRPGSPAPA